MPNKSKKEPPLNPDDHGLEPAKGPFLAYQAEDGKLNQRKRKGQNHEQYPFEV